MESDELRTELIACYKGCARIALSSLEYGSARDEDAANVERLLNIFGRGCHRYDPDHFVPVLIESQTLQQALTRLSLDASDLKYQAPPLLCLPDGVRLRCLHGRHRLLAAEEYFEVMTKEEQWWAVKLFDSGT